jgi:hypothetical protein
MSVTPLLPQSFWFRLALPCRRRDGLPRTGTGRLLDLPAECALPPVRALDGVEPWAEVRAAWNPDGLAVAVLVTGKDGPIGHNPHDPAYCDGVQLWIDTRDTRDVHRATRFCHRFKVQVERVGKGKDLAAEVSQLTIHRAQADAPKAPPKSVRARAEAVAKGWHLELFFPAAALHGFDPETNRRLGLMYQVTDPARGDQFLGVGREFPVGEDPSLWATLELVG